MPSASPFLSIIVITPWIPKKKVKLYNTCIDKGKCNMPLPFPKTLVDNIFCHSGQILKGRVVITPKYFNIFAPFLSQEFLASVYLVSFSRCLFFYVIRVYRGNSFAVPVNNDVLGPAAAYHVI